MTARRTPEEAMALIARETRWRNGPVPNELAGDPVAPGFRATGGGCFLQRCESGYGYLYRPGEGIVVERPRDADPDEEQLWLNGSVYAAVACLNGFLPIHASAVAHRGRVIAFTGPSGAGKSTLVTALGRHGLPMFCDDTLVLDLSDPGRIVCMPGHKRLKLTPHALELTGTGPEQPVGAETGKFYAAPPGGTVATPLPLHSLVFLEEGGETDWEPILGAQKFARLEDDHYTQDIYREVHRASRTELFGLRARMAREIAMARLVRPVGAEGFAASVAVAARKIGELEFEG